MSEEKWRDKKTAEERCNTFVKQVLDGDIFKIDNRKNMSFTTDKETYDFFTSPENTRHLIKYLDYFVDRTLDCRFTKRDVYVSLKVIKDMTEQLEKSITDRIHSNHIEYKLDLKLLLNDSPFLNKHKPLFSSEENVIVAEIIEHRKCAEIQNQINAKFSGKTVEQGDTPEPTITRKLVL